MGREIPHNLSQGGINTAVAGLISLFAVLLMNAAVNADQAGNIYGIADPFDPSEVISHTPKDEIHLRVKLPAPDLPPSVVQSAQPTIPDEHPKQVQVKEDRIDPKEPGIIQQSVQSVLSIFDWPDADEGKSSSEVSETAALIKEHEPIRINIHVGIKPPETASEDEETSNLQSPVSRAQSRVRRLFTFSEPDTHD